MIWVGQVRVTVKNSSPQQTVGQLLVTCLLTVSRLSANYWPAVSLLKTNRLETVCQLTLLSDLSADCQPTIGVLSAICR